MDAVSPFLQYRRSDILSGQLWRLVSAHFVHSTVIHLLWNGLSFCIFWSVFCRYLSLRYVACAIMFMCLFTSLGLLLCNPEVQWYQGFSGILHGLFLLGAIDDIAQKRAGGYPLLCLIVFKLSWEALYGYNTDAQMIGPVIVNAHLYGGLSGAMVAGWRWFYPTMRSLIAP